MSPTKRLSNSGLNSLAVLLFLSLSACGGSGSGEENDFCSDGAVCTFSGQFIDSRVQGVWFESPTHSGFTDADGTFLFESFADLVDFSIGDIALGTSFAQSIVTPISFESIIDLDGEPAGVIRPIFIDMIDPAVINRIRFIQSLDEDGNPDNGIVISNPVFMQAAGRSMDFSLDTPAFEIAANALLPTLTSGSVTSLVDSLDARLHFLESIRPGVGPGSGTLMLSGADAATLGNSFDASLGSVDGGGEFTEIVIWNGDFHQAVRLFFNESKIESIRFLAASTANPYNYHYFHVLCFEPSLECAGVDIDMTLRSVSFNNVVMMPPRGLFVEGFTDVSSGTMTLNGTINW